MVTFTIVPNEEKEKITAMKNVSIDVFREYIDAYNFLSSLPDTTSVAVRFYKLPDDVKSKKLDELNRRLKENAKKLDNFSKSKYFEGMTSALITCRKCGSKVNKDYISTHFCPVCNNDMRSDTIKQRERNIKGTYQNICTAIQEEKSRLTSKYGKIMWLVKNVVD